MVKSQRQRYSRLLTALVIVNFIGIGIGLVISLIFLIPNKFKQQYNEQQGNIVVERLV